MANRTFLNLYTMANQWAGTTDDFGVARSKQAVDEANRLLSYGKDLTFKPWWRKREDTITPVAGTQTYAFPTAQGTLESLHQVWYRSSGQRQEIEIVDDKRWAEEANEDATQRSTPDICNIHQSAGTANIRFSPTPSASFISAIVSGVLRLDFFIEEVLNADSGDTVEPLMPDTRRYGIAWCAIAQLAGMQGDTDLVKYAEQKAKQYMDLIRADDILRTGSRNRTARPIGPMGLRGSSRIIDYGHRK